MKQKDSRPKLLFRLGSKATEVVTVKKEKRFVLFFFGNVEVSFYIK